MAPQRRRSGATAWSRCLFLVALTAALPCVAQYKVVDPDGKVTYTDRPPANSEGKVSSLGSRGPAPVSSEVAALPAELRQPVSRYPVTLYVVAGSCDPCAQARQLLHQRGVPYSEKLILTAEDSEALERMSGGRDAPTLTIGTQTLRGLAPEVWGSYLDAAGYPRESKLPATYQYPPATPLTERREASATRPPAGRASQPSAPEAPAQANPLGIKF